MRTAPRGMQAGLTPTALTYSPPSLPHVQLLHSQLPQPGNTPSQGEATRDWQVVVNMKVLLVAGVLTRGPSQGTQHRIQLGPNCVLPSDAPLPLPRRGTGQRQPGRAGLLSAGSSKLTVPDASGRGSTKAQRTSPPPHETKRRIRNRH